MFEKEKSDRHKEEELQNKLSEWRRVYKCWNVESFYYQKYSRIYDYLVIFVENLLVCTYGKETREITDLLYQSRSDLKLIPFAAYIIVKGETIERKIKERIAMTLECKYFSVLENKRSKVDYLGYLLSSNIEEDMKSYIDVLNSEISLVGKIIDEEITDEKGKKEILLWLTKTLTQNDIPAKQFVILYVLYVSDTYKKYFLSIDITQDIEIKVNPERFIYFVKRILPENFKKLMNGIFTGSLEFVSNTSPMYNLII